MGLLLQVNQPNDLVFVQRQQDRLGILAPVGAEGINFVARHKSEGTVAALAWTHPPLFSGIYRLYSIFREFSIRSERFTTSEFEVHPHIDVDGYRVNNKHYIENAEIYYTS